MALRALLYGLATLLFSLLAFAQAPALSVTKTADATPVTTGTTIGFTVQVSNSSAAGTGTAINAHMADSLPSIPGMSWKINPPYTGPGTCNVVGTDFSCSFGNLAPGAQATIHVQTPTFPPPASSAGTYNNQAFVSADNQSSTGSNVVTIVVQPGAPPMITKSFGAAAVLTNNSTKLIFTITNPNSTLALTGIGFTDTLPAGVVVATPNGLTGSCGGGAITANAGSGAVSLTDASLAAATSCTFSLTVVGVTEGVKINTTSAVTSMEAGNGSPASATLKVGSPATLTKAFADSLIQVLGPGDTTALSFVLMNTNASTTLTGLAFNDLLPSGLIVSTPNGVTGSCGAGIIIADAGSNSISLSGGSLGPGASCTFSVNVTGIAIGVQTNTTGTVSSNEVGPGAPATATTSVVNLIFEWFFLESGGGSSHF